MKTQCPGGINYIDIYNVIYQQNTIKVQIKLTNYKMIKLINCKICKLIYRCTILIFFICTVYNITPLQDLRVRLVFNNQLYLMQRLAQRLGEDISNLINTMNVFNKLSTRHFFSYKMNGNSNMFEVSMLNAINSDVNCTDIVTIDNQRL